jgi:hypothetical protein
VDERIRFALERFDSPEKGVRKKGSELLFDSLSVAPFTFQWLSSRWGEDAGRSLAVS